jgi:hypothetical protein
MELVRGVAAEQRDRDDDELVGAVCRYVTAALREGEAAVVVATPSHTAALDAALRVGGVPPDEAREAGGLVSLDAAGLLSQFMREGRQPGRLVTPSSGQRHRCRRYAHHGDQRHEQRVFDKARSALHLHGRVLRPRVAIRLYRHATR